MPLLVAWADGKISRSNILYAPKTVIKSVYLMENVGNLYYTTPPLPESAQGHSVVIRERPGTAL